MSREGRLSGRAILGGALASAFLLTGLGVTPSEAAFARRKVLTVDRNRVPGTANHLDFPVLVSISGDANLRTTANGGFVTSTQGHDILFRGEDAATCAPLASPCRLDHEIESYDGATGTLVAWVRVPTLQYTGAGANSVIYLYYGDATVTCSQQNRTAVWNSGYREVLHLDGSGDQEDSTVNAFTAAARGAVTTGAAGKVGPAVDLASGASGLTPAYLNVSDGTLPTGTSFTLEAWVNLRTINAGQYVGLVTKGRECLNFDGDPHTDAPDCTVAPCGDWTGLYKLPDGSSNDVFSFEWAYGTPCKAAGLQDPGGAGATPVAGTWYHVAASFDSGTSTRRLLVNGVEVASDTLGACIEAPIPHYTRLGTDSNEDYLDGLLDEVRISFTARSNGWIAAGYNNQNSPATFYASTTDAAGPFAVAPTACPARNPCAGGSGNCYYRSIGTAANYTTGSVAATNGSSVVVGLGTSWQSANRGRGDRITIDGIDYTILAVDAESQLRLTSPFTGATGPGKPYTIARKFTTLQAWEDCIDGPGGAGCEGVFSASLVTDGRSEIGVAYKDSTFTSGGAEILLVDGSTTDAAHTITLTADGPNRHYGVSGAGVVLDNASNASRAVAIQDQHVTVEWLEVRGGSGAGAVCIDYLPASAPNQAVIRNNIVRNCGSEGIRTACCSTVTAADITNNVIYRGTRSGVRIAGALGTGTGSRVRVLNNTFLRNGSGVGTPWTEISSTENPNPYVTLRNNIVVDDAQSPDLTWNGANLCTNAALCDWWNAASGDNIVGDAAPPTGKWQSDIGPNPRGGGLHGATEASLSFVSTAASSENLHIQAGSAAWNRGSDLTGLVQGDIDAAIRTAPWDVGADELPPAAAPPLIAYSDSSPPEPALRPLRFTTLAGGVWSAPGQVAVPGPFPTSNDWPLFNKVARTSADGLRRGVVFAEADTSNRNPLHATFWDGSSWTNGAGGAGSHYFGLTGDATSIVSRHFDAAFEQQSGDLLVVTGINADESVDIYLHNGSAWSGNLRFTPALNGVMTDQTEVNSMVFRWVRLDPRPGSNRVAFIGLAQDTPTQTFGVVHAAIWNGDTNAFGSKTILSLPVTDGQNSNVGEAVDIDYVRGGSNAGEALAVWGTQTTLYRAICSAAGTWGGRAAVQDLGAGNTLRWIRQKAAPDGRMVLAIEDVNERIYTIAYNGDTRAFSSFTVVPHTMAAFGNADLNRPFDVAWDPGSGAGSVLLVYSDTTGIRYRTSANGGATWSGEQTLTTLYQARWVQLERDPSNVVHLVVMDQANDLRAWRWTASAWSVTTPSLPSTDVERNGASLNVEGFALATWPPTGSGTTAVKLMSFSALPGDGSVVLRWQTGSELDNLGFHVHRGPSAEGPWTRLTGSLVPGLGSSPLGQSYSWPDTDVVNGVRYYYRLEDVDAASVSTFHGPVSAVPEATGTGGGDGEPEGPSEESGGGEGDGGSGGEETAQSCPPWLLVEAGAAPDAVCQRHGDPDSVSVAITSSDATGATVELRTGGFWTVEEDGGTVRVAVPGLEVPSGAGALALPVRRVLVPAVVGRGVELLSVESLEPRRFPQMRPSAAGRPEMLVSSDGTVRASRRALRAPVLSRGLWPRDQASLSGTVFQAGAKSAVVEIAPVRFDASREDLVLSGRVVVRLSFSGAVEGETGSGGTGRSVPGWGKTGAGRRLPRKGEAVPEVVARLHTRVRGLHAVRFEDVLGRSSRPVSVSGLRLQRQGEAAAFHVEPPGGVFGPGSTLYFHADETARAEAFTEEVAYELVRSREGRTMELVPGRPAGAPLASPSRGSASFETNRIYQPGLLEAKDLWLWEALAGGVVRVKPFTLRGVDPGSPLEAELTVDLQGGSDAAATTDHHVRVSVNGIEVGETVFGGKRPHVLRAALPASLLREGTNELALVNVGDTGVYSLVFLDRFSVGYPQQGEMHEGAFEGAWAQGGVAEVSGASGPVAVVDVTEGAAARWVRSVERSGDVVRFEAEAERRYVVATAQGLVRPRVSRAGISTLRDSRNQADYLLVAPRAFLEAAQPLLDRRASQGLVSRGVAFEEIVAEFGHGQPSAEAIRAFLAHTYHRWSPPSPRYVVLLGDSTYDPRNFVGNAWPSPLPALWARTSYLWTASDPLLAEVNGEDALPDLAIGRLPATTVEQAESLVSKLLAWEESGQGLSGRAVLVADDPDAAGDFEAGVEDIKESFFASRETTILKLRELGPSTMRDAIRDAFDEGSSLMGYVGHGGAAVWASENVWNSWDASSLRAQSRQPLLLTLNCLNGYFVAPNHDSLAEAMVKAEGRGAVAGFSPSGLSLDGPAHQYHRALVGELVGGRHERLGDAVLAAQQAYAQTGLMPELLAIYHLVGDPATRIR